MNPKIRNIVRAAALMWIIVPAAGYAEEDTIYMEETVISGNQELPKVLYILPWREMTAGGLPERTLQFEHSNVMTPVYPADYQRELGFRQQLKQQTLSENTNQSINASSQKKGE